MENINNFDQIIDNNIQSISNKPNKNIFKILFIISLLVVIGLIIFIFFSLKINNPNNQITKTEIIPTSAPINNTNMINNQNINYGTVEGEIHYPADGVLNGYILAKNIETKKIEGQFHTDGMIFSMNLPEGEYFLIYRVEEGSVNVQLDHTKCGFDYSSEGCQTTESHQPLKIKVIAGNKTTGINLSTVAEKPNFFNE